MPGHRYGAGAGGGQRKRELVALPATGHAGKIPRLPTAYRQPTYHPKTQRWSSRQQRFLASTRAWYETWGRSPIATTFTDVDWQTLQRLAVLVDRYERTGDLKLAKEVRIVEASFGGSPSALRKLGHHVDPPTSVEQEEKPLGQRMSEERRRRIMGLAPTPG